MSTYRWWLGHFTATVGDVAPITIGQFFVRLQHSSASHQYEAYRTFRTFFRWRIETGALTDNPLRGFTDAASNSVDMSEGLIRELHKIIMCGFDSLEPGSYKVATFLVSHFWGMPSDMAVADIGGRWSDVIGVEEVAGSTPARPDQQTSQQVVYSDRPALGGSFLPAIRADCSELANRRVRAGPCAK